MYTIKQAARLTGVPETSLRAWERRYGVVTPHRNDAGYRIYDDDAVAALSSMRRLVEARWSPAEAARPSSAGASRSRTRQHPARQPGPSRSTRSRP